MLTVLPIQSKSEQETACARCSVPFHADDLAYAAEVDNTLVGICQFHLGKNGGVITEFAPCLADGREADNEALFIMARGCLNFIDLCGVHKAFFDASFHDSALIHAIGFQKNKDDRWEMDLTDFFDHPCKHKN